MDVTGRMSKQSNGATRGSVWETRMRIDQVKGGIKVFGVVEQEDGGRGSDVWNHHGRQEGEEDEAMRVIANSSTSPLNRNVVRGGKRRTWKPQPKAFEGPIWLISEGPERTERSPGEGTKSRSESTEESKMGKSEFLQKAGQKISNGFVSGGPTGISENGSEKQFNGSPEKVTVVHSKKKLTATSHNDLPRKPTNHEGQFGIGPKVLRRNDGANDDEEEDEFFDIKEMSSAEQKPKAAVPMENKVQGSLSMEKPTEPIPAPVIKQQPGPSPVTKHSTVHQCYAKESVYGWKHDSKRHNIVHSLLDLVMWRDVPRSAICFGLGTFIMITSSYMDDPNMRFISTISHLGLACLAAIFFYRSIIWRGYVDVDDTSFYELGEEEALCLTKLVLPYLNDLLRKSKALLSGDPATTMKLAVLLFVLASCGSFVTMWNMIKLGFLIAFTIPKLWSLYSTQLADQGKYWVQLSQALWDLCPQRKAVAAVVVIPVVGYSSNFTRIWAGFMLLVALRYYQQSLARDGSPESCRGAEEKTGRAKAT